jgi:hypothetical protein
MAFTALALAAALASTGFDGEVLARIWRRFPECRGVVEGAYAGDETCFLCRSQMETGGFRAILITEKDRGEEWGDLLAGGACWTGSSFLRSASAGWLRAKLGSGLVLGGSSSWGASAPGLDARPPDRATRADPATGAGSCDGSPLTGASVTAGAAGVSITLLQGLSALDPSGSGLHRTPSEIEAKGSIRESLSAARVTFGGFGATLAGRSLEGDRCLRSGLDFGLDAAGAGFSGEVSWEHDSCDTAAFWVAMSEASDQLRFCGAAFSTPEDFGDDRTSSPAGLECDLGCGAALRWRPAMGWLGALSVSAGSAGGCARERGSAEVSKRFSPDLEMAVSGRLVLDRGEWSSRATTSLSWRTAGQSVLSVEVQATSAGNGERRDTGGAVEGRIRWKPSEKVSISAGCAGYSTTGYAARAYCGELGFPGESGSTAVWGEGFLMQVSATFTTGVGIEIRGRLSRAVREEADSMGSGLEETEGGTRTEAGLQLEFPL